MTFTTNPFEPDDGDHLKEECGVFGIIGDVDAADMALDGEYEVGEGGGVRARPAFALLREHLAKHTPEWGEKITTVPAANIRRLAREFAQEARIGSTIVVDGVTLELRQLYEADDFGEEFTPALRAQEERFREREAQNA